MDPGLMHAVNLLTRKIETRSNVQILMTESMVRMTSAMDRLADAALLLGRRLEERTKDEVAP